MTDLPITSDEGATPVVINDPVTTTNVAGVTASSSLKTDITTVAGSGVATASTGVQKVGIADSSGNSITSTSSALDVNLKSSSITLSENIAQIGGNTVITGGANGLLAVGGPVASGGANADNPVKSGAVFNTTQPTVTNGQIVDAQATARGARIVSTGVDVFNVTVNTALPAGTNVIGHVITDSGSVTSASQSGTWTVQPGNTANTTPWLTTISQGGNSATVTASNALKVDGSAVTQPVSGTVTANQGTAVATTAGWPVVGGTVTESTAAWTSSTSLNTTLAQTVTGYDSVLVTLNQTSTITGGVVTFEVSDTVAFTNAYPVQAVQINAANWGPTYTLVANTNQAFYVNIRGGAAFRVRLSTVISGTGTVNVGIASNTFSGDPVIVGLVNVTQNTSPWVDNITQIAGNAIATAASGIAKVGLTDGSGNAITSTSNALDENVKSWLGSTAPTVGQKTSANSVPVVIASDQSTISVQDKADATITSSVGTASGFAIGISGLYTTTQPAPTNGQQVELQTDQSGNLLNFLGVSFKAGSAWNSSTAINTNQYPTGTTTQGAFTGATAYLIQLDQTTTLTGGAVTFQGTYDNINWITVPTAQVLAPATFDLLSNPYTFVASTNQPFLILAGGFIAIRAQLTTVISGTGTVTPYWSTVSFSPLTFVREPHNSNRTYITFTTDELAAPTTEALQTFTINKGGTTSSGTSYTVTSGKILRLQSIDCTMRSSSGTNIVRVRLRSASSVSATSPIIWLNEILASTGVIDHVEQTWPDEIEISGGQQIGISAVSSNNTSNAVTICLVGYEY